MALSAAPKKAALAEPPRRALIDPEALAPDPDFKGASVRGEPLAPVALTPAALRARFALAPPWPAEILDDRLPGTAGEARRAAAVLVPLVHDPRGLQVLLTRRTDHLHDHAGQISFPGGGLEDGDADAVATALRETHEEVGLAPARVEVLGVLPTYLTATGYDITPVVGLVERPLDLRLDTFEVAEAFEVPLAFLMDPANHQRLVAEVGAVRRLIYAMPYQGARRYMIWGATAAMLRNLYRFLGPRTRP